MHSYTRLLSTIAVLLLPLPLLAQETGQPAAIWHDRGEAAALNLTDGPGGNGREPGRDFRFLEESTSGTSPKFDVEDERGVRWKVKLGEEARSETAAARLLWAAGYAVDEDYYRPQIRVHGLTRLARGQQFVSEGGIVTGVRLERYQKGESNTWSWYDNPFVGTREFNGLRVLMALINNWDLKTINNSTSIGGAQYGIADLGATFGRTGNFLSRSKAVFQDYTESRFIDKVTATHVDFVLHSRPFFPTIVDVSNYRFRTRIETVVKHIPIADARWIGDLLGQLSAEQIRDGFRAGGFSPAETNAYSEVVLQRIAALKQLELPRPSPSVASDADTTAQPAADADAARCVKSTCRDIPLRETLTAIDLKNPYVHAIMGGFEQGSGLGGGVQLTSATTVPGVDFRAAALISARGSQRFDLGAFFPRIGGTRNFADVWVSDVQRDIAFFGIGPRTSPDLETDFAIERRSYQGSLYRDLSDDAQGGVYAQLMNTRSVLGGQVTASEILSYGGFLSYDTRDNSVGLTRGVNLYARITSASGPTTVLAPGGFGWMETEVDVRGYVPIGSPRTSLLMRSRGQLKSPTAGHEIPYYDLSWLGGRTFLRGSPSYRYRGHNVVLLATELQQTVFSISTVRGVDLFASADKGQVWSDSREFTRSNWRSGVGGGLQYRHSRSIAARIEASRGDERTLLYLSLSRGF